MRKTQVKLRAEVLQLMIQLWTQRAVKIEHMCGTNGIEYVMCILKSASGTKFTRFTSTKVQILTPFWRSEEIRCSAIVC